MRFTFLGRHGEVDLINKQKRLFARIKQNIIITFVTGVAR